MQWSLVETEWYLPFSMRPFVFIFMFFLFWLPVLFVSHYVLFFRLNGHFKRFRESWPGQANGSVSGPASGSRSKVSRNPLIKGLMQSVSELVAAPAERVAYIGGKFSAEIDYFLAKCELRLKASALVLTFCLAGLLLLGLKNMVFDELQTNLTVFKDPMLARMLANLPTMFFQWIFCPTIIALTEIFLVIWLIIAKKKMALRLGHDWEAIVEAVAEKKLLQ